jgi:FkbM family methyltransferase
VEPYEIIERRTPGGRIAYLAARVSTNDGAIAQGILQDDEYRLRSMYPIDGWLIDVGAHIGTVAIAAALDNPDLRVVAVEALPENAAIIVDNVARNNLTDRVFVEAAGATNDRRKTVKVTYNARNEGDEVVPAGYLDQCRYVGNIFQKHPGISIDTVEVPGLSLSAILRKYAIDHVSVLKIDCEGCEWQFLRSKDIGRVEEIVGEYHDAFTYEDLVAILERTHIVEQWTTGNVGLFGAQAR